MAKSTALKSKPSVTPINTGVEKEDCRELAGVLSEVLADTYVLYLKTQNFHWNVVGPMFYGLHKLTEKQYQDMAIAIDDIAERIRTIGHVAPGSFEKFYKLTSIKEESGSPTAEEMIEQLVSGNEVCSRKLRNAVLEAEKLHDVKTADLLIQRIGNHEQNAWMLRSLLE